MRTQRQRSRIACLATLALAALALTSLAALGPRYGGRLAIGVLDLDADTSPRFTRNHGTRLLLGLRHETLVTRDANGTILPSLAQRWSSAASGREWAFELVGSARFHNDSPVTAEHVVRSVLRFLRSDSPAAALLAARLDGGEDYRRGKSDSLAAVSADTPHRVTLRFLAEQSAPPVELASPAAAITGAEGVACGPFLVAHVVRGERAALLPFDRHVRGRPFVDNLDLVRFADRPALRLALERGTVQAALGEPGATPRIARLLLLLDPAREPFDTLPERRRVARAFDRDLLVRRFMPEAQPLWRLLPTAPAPSDTSARPETPSHPDVPLVLNVDAGLSPLTSQRVVAYLVALGYRVTVAVLAPDDVVATAADARLLLWCPEVDDPLLTLHELALLARTLKPPQQAALATESARGPLRTALEEQERSLLATYAVVPLALAPLAAISPAAVGVGVAPTGTLLLEDAWLPL
jgi:hypothetical protein